MISSLQDDGRVVLYSMGINTVQYHRKYPSMLLHLWKAYASVGWMQMQMSADTDEDPRLYLRRLYQQSKLSDRLEIG